MHDGRYMAAGSQELPDRSSIAMNKDNRTPSPTPPGNDPPESRLLLWGLRLWILAALVIVAFALANYILNHLIVR